MILRSRPSPALTIIYASAFFRSLGVGLTGVVLGIYLSRTGGSATFIGVVIAAGLAGGGLCLGDCRIRGRYLGQILDRLARGLFWVEVGQRITLTSEHLLIV